MRVQGKDHQPRQRQDGEPPEAPGEPQPSHQEGRGERRDRLADVPGPVDPDGRALSLRRIPAVDEPDADREARQSDADQEPTRQELPVRGHPTHKYGRDDRAEHDADKNDPAAVDVRQDPERDAPEAPEQDRGKCQFF